MALITGGARGQGAAEARLFADVLLNNAGIYRRGNLRNTTLAARCGA